MNLSAISLWTTREDHQFFLSRRSLLSFTPRGFGRCNAKSAPLEMRTKKKRRPLPARRPPPPRSSSFHALKREHAIFFWCELELVNSKAKRRSFFGIIGGGSVLFTFCFPYFFFVICILDVSVSLPTQNERLFVKARLCDFCGGRRRF